MHYCASLFDDALTQCIFQQVAQAAQLAVTPLADTVRVSRRGALTYVFNYGDTAYTIDDVRAEAFVIGSPSVEPQGVAVYRAS